MNTEQVLKLNQVEKAEYVKPKWWAKEGERLIEVTAEAGGNLILRASLTDDKVLWFSQSQWSDEETLSSILQVIIDTGKEPNKVWHTTELKKVLAPLGISYTRLERGFCRTVRIYPDHFTDWRGLEQPLTEVAARTLARQFVLLMEEQREKARSAIESTILRRLEAIEQALRPLTEITEPSRMHQVHSQAKKLFDELLSMEFIKISEDAKLRDTYGLCESMYQSVYNHAMSAAR